MPAFMMTLSSAIPSLPHLKFPSYGMIKIFMDLEKWYSESQAPIAMWQENPGTIAPSFGSWYYAGSTKYIGIRMNKNKYGWIEVDATDPYHPMFTRYAIQK
jgi:hypothetical protein